MSCDEPKRVLFFSFAIVAFALLTFTAIMLFNNSNAFKNYDDRIKISEFCKNNNMTFNNMTRQKENIEFYCRLEIKTIDKCWNETNYYPFEGRQGTYRNTTKCNYTISYEPHLYEFKNNTFNKIQRIEINI